MHIVEMTLKCLLLFHSPIPEVKGKQKVLWVPTAVSYVLQSKLAVHQHFVMEEKMVASFQQVLFVEEHQGVLEFWIAIVQSHYVGFRVM